MYFIFQIMFFIFSIKSFIHRYSKLLLIKGVSISKGNILFLLFQHNMTTVFVRIISYAYLYEKKISTKFYFSGTYTFVPNEDYFFGEHWLIVLWGYFAASAIFQCVLSKNWKSCKKCCQYSYWWLIDIRVMIYIYYYYLDLQQQKL